MKNNLFRLIIGLFYVSFPALCTAQVTVVRLDGKKVYLDTSSSSKKIEKDQTFKIILSSEKLINPKTGKNLGNIYQYSPEGKIIEVQPLYAIGELPNTANVSVGQEAVLGEISTPRQKSHSLFPAEKVSAPEVRKKIIYAPIAQKIISVSQAAVNAPGEDNIITLSDEGQVTVWTRGGNQTLAEVLSYTIPSSAEPITLSAVPVKEGLSQIFAVVYYPSRKTFSTLVLENKNGKLEQTASLPYFMKELGCGKEKTLWAQTPFVSGAQPGNARLVSYQDGKYTVAKEGFSTQRNWLTGLTCYDLEKPGSSNLIYTYSNGTVRAVLQNENRAESENLFATAPNRVKYKQEILEFYPSVQAFGPQGNATIAAVENEAKIGLLSKMFGQYRSSNIHFMSFENGKLHVTDTTPLEGIVYDTACSDRAVLAAEIFPNGSSSVVEIFK